MSNVMEDLRSAQSVLIKLEEDWRNLLNLFKAAKEFGKQYEFVDRNLQKVVDLKEKLERVFSVGISTNSDLVNARNLYAEYLVLSATMSQSVNEEIESIHEE